MVAANAASVAPGQDILTSFFHEILDGFLACVGDACVCDYPNGKKLPYALAKSKKSYCTVSRMLPALAAWVQSGRDDVRAPHDRVRRVILQTFQQAFDPDHPEYWLPSPTDAADLRQVESSLVAWTLWLSRDWLPESLGSAGRSQVQAWLASCTVKSVRANNFAWFTAVNQAARLALSKEWKEFQGDADWMLEDLQAMDAMHVGDGWYSDGKDTHIHDYYSLWVFTSHYLYWREIIGGQYPEWVAKHDGRVRRLMQDVPLLFGTNGCHALMGVSLVYRWAVLSAPVLAYRQGLWPHSPGALRWMVEKNLGFFRQNGGFDAALGKIPERMSPVGTPEFAESYIDNGHPYWGMQSFALWLLPKDDAFWAAPLQEPRTTTTQQIAGPALTIHRAKGDARMAFANSGRYDPSHRDRYVKFSYSAQFPFCYTKRRDRATWDNNLVFTDSSTGFTTTRAGVESGRLIEQGVETIWWAELNGQRIRVRSRIQFSGSTELREHLVESTLDGIVVREGSTAISWKDEPPAEKDGLLLTSKARVGCLQSKGYDERRMVSSFAEELGRDNIHLFAPRCSIVTLTKALRAPRTKLQSRWLAEVL